jgi:hypothetical protein
MPDLADEVSTKESVTVVQVRRIESFCPPPLKAEIGQGAPPERRPDMYRQDEEHAEGMHSKLLPLLRLDVLNACLEIDAAYSALQGVRNNAALSVPFAAHLSKQSFVNTGLGAHFPPFDFFLNSACGSALLATNQRTLETAWNLQHHQPQQQQLQQHQHQQLLYLQQQRALSNLLLGHHSASSPLVPCGSLPALGAMPVAAPPRF